MLRGEVVTRLSYLCEVGLGYLTLDRSTRTLSGGEVQRVNLTTCLGASLVNTLFVMDEPSVGLHPRDVGRLIRVMHDLRDKGNTLLVVEHEEAIIRSADHLIDIGPGRGEQGGELIFSGSLAAMEKKAARSLTRDYLTGEKRIPVPKSRRKSTAAIKITGARENNLKNVERGDPAGRFHLRDGRLRFRKIDAHPRRAFPKSGAGQRTADRAGAGRVQIGHGRASDRRSRDGGSIAARAHAAFDADSLPRSLRSRARTLRRLAGSDGAGTDRERVFVQLRERALRTLQRARVSRRSRCNS